MELWSHVIVEWINCLDVSETPIKDIKQLQSERCYEKLINLLSWKNKNVSANNDLVTRFLEDEYPEFKMEDKEEERDLNNIYIGALLLLYVSQELVFHRPMCVKLQHDTQIKIKTFLEMVLPYGKNVTKAILCEVLAELGDTTPKTPSVTPKTKSLQEFFNTPASRSAQSHKRIFEHNRELRHLRSELEMERFEKADLQLDLENQQKKIQSLQEKLQEKASEIKLLKEEQMRPSTPQSCKKHQNIKHYEDLRRKEVDRLEQELLQRQCEVHNVEEEKESVLKKLVSMERQCVMLKEKCAGFESSMESLLIQIEYRDRELIDLRMANEELHAHLEEYKKSCLANESCEFDSVLVPPSPKAGEVLSTVIDLQLQEVKIESDRLKAQLESANEKLRCMLEENEGLTRVNSTLQDDLRKMTEYIEENVRLKEIAVQKGLLEEEVVKLQDTIAAKDELLLSLSVSLERFNVDVQTKIEDLSNKVDQSAERVKRLEDSKNELQKNYESKIALMTSDAQDLKVEREKILIDLQKLNDRNELLQVETNDMSHQIKSKDEKIEALSSEVKSLKTDCEHLAFSVKEQELLRSLKESLETQLLDKQRLLEQANNDTKLKEEALTDLQSKIEQLATEKDEILKQNTSLHDKISKANEELQAMTEAAALRDSNDKCEEMKRISANEMKLQSQVDSLSKEKKVLKEKLDTVRVRNVKLERNMDELRSELKKMKTEQESTSLLPDIEKLKQEVARLKEENVLLTKKIEDLSKQPNEEDFENRLKDVHGKYEEKLEEIKQKMKIAYNEQVAKLNKMQALAIQKKVDSLRTQMEQQCLKHTEEISRYKAHVGDLNKQFWHTAEKFLTEQQQKQEAIQQLNELKIKFQRLQFDVPVMQTAVSKQHKCFKPEKTDFASSYLSHESVRTIKHEESNERRLSVRSIQTMGNAFKTADEEGEVFDNIYLADMKEGYCLPTHDIDRLSVLQQRNSLYLPHLKSSYPAEMQFYPLGFNEEEIKTGSVTDDVFNDSLSQSLLPEQKPKKKDRTQTSYKKPGPPTPSKNGGRLSLQANEHRSPGSRILRERNSDRRTTTTPRGFKHMFNIKRQDENSSGTPRRRISSIFRKNRPIERQQKL